MASNAKPRSESAAVEDYLERIHDLIDSKGYARVADVAEGLQISQASVSNMMQRLDEKGLLNYEKYRGVTLTSAGEDLAKRITLRHSILEEFLSLIGIEKDIAYADTEGMEHHISSETLGAIEQIVAELKTDPAMRQRVAEAASQKRETPL